VNYLKPANVERALLLPVRGGEKAGEERTSELANGGRRPKRRKRGKISGRFVPSFREEGVI